MAPSRGKSDDAQRILALGPCKHGRVSQAPQVMQRLTARNALDDPASSKATQPILQVAGSCPEGLTVQFPIGLAFGARASGLPDLRIELVRLRWGDTGQVRHWRTCHPAAQPTHGPTCRPSVTIAAEAGDAWASAAAAVGRHTRRRQQGGGDVSGGSRLAQYTSTTGALLLFSVLYYDAAASLGPSLVLPGLAVAAAEVVAAIVDRFSAPPPPSVVAGAGPASSALMGAAAARPEQVVAPDDEGPMGRCRSLRHGVGQEGAGHLEGLSAASSAEFPGRPRDPDLDAGAAATLESVLAGQAAQSGVIAAGVGRSATAQRSRRAGRGFRRRFVDLAAGLGRVSGPAAAALERVLVPSTLLSLAGRAWRVVHASSAALAEAVADLAAVGLSYSCLARQAQLGRLPPGPAQEGAWRQLHKAAAQRLARHLGDLPDRPPLAPALLALQRCSIAAGLAVDGVPLCGALDALTAYSTGGGAGHLHTYAGSGGGGGDGGGQSRLLLSFSYCHRRRQQRRRLTEAGAEGTAAGVVAVAEAVEQQPQGAAPAICTTEDNSSGRGGGVPIIVVAGTARAAAAAANAIHTPAAAQPTASTPNRLQAPCLRPQQRCPEITPAEKDQDSAGAASASASAAHDGYIIPPGQSDPVSSLPELQQQQQQVVMRQMAPRRLAGPAAAVLTGGRPGGPEEQIASSLAAADRAPAAAAAALTSSAARRGLSRAASASSLRAITAPLQPAAAAAPSPPPPPSTGSAWVNIAAAVMTSLCGFRQPSVTPLPPAQQQQPPHLRPTDGGGTFGSPASAASFNSTASTISYPGLQQLAPLSPVHAVLPPPGRPSATTGDCSSGAGDGGCSSGCSSGNGDGGGDGALRCDWELPALSRAKEALLLRQEQAAAEALGLPLYGKTDHAATLHDHGHHHHHVRPAGLQERLGLACRAAYLLAIFAPFLTLGVALLMLSVILLYGLPDNAAAAAGGAVATVPEPTGGGSAAAAGAGLRAGLALRCRRVSWRLLLGGCRRSGAAFIKWGQWSATRVDLFPDDFCEALSELHDQAPRHSFAFTRRQVERSFGVPLDRMFEAFDPRPVASGSIAQVHRALMRRSDGSPLEVAVKVVHPHVELRIRQDFALLQPAAAALGRLRSLRSLSLPETVSQFSGTMTAQADLRVEAAHLRRFYTNFSRVASQVTTPRPLPGLVRQEVLVESWEAGVGVSSFIRQPGPHNTAVVALGVDTYLQMLLQDNFVHTDLHPGNIMVRLVGADGRPLPQHLQGPGLTPSRTGTEPSGAGRGTAPAPATDAVATATATASVSARVQLILLDFGLAEELTPLVRHHFISFLHHLMRGDGAAAASHLLRWTSRRQACPDPAALVADMEALAAARCDVGAAAGMDLDAVMKDVLRLARTHGVTIDSCYAALVIAVCVLVGFATSLDPAVNLVDAAVPALLAHALTGRVVGRLYS